jgi:uncharacterized protein YegL
MTDQNYRHVCLIIDRSGSMRKVEADMNGGIRQFMEEQAQVPKRTSVSLYQFDTEHDTVLDFQPLTAGVLGEWKLIPRGGTALLDAVGAAVVRTGEKLASMAEEQRPSEVVIMIVTDGHENSSREYQLPEIKEMITRQREDYDWVFMFLGADQDAFETGGTIGIARANIANYARHNSVDMFTVASASMTRGAGGQSMGYSYTPEERQKLTEEKPEQ